MLYGVLCSCAYKSGDHCWPSQAYLADSMGVSTRSIQNYLGELQKLQLIMIQRGRAGSSLKYYFLKSALVAPSSSSEKTSKEQIVYSKENTDSSHAKAACGYENFAYIDNINRFKTNTPPTPSQARIFTPDLTKSGGGGFSSALKSAEEGFIKVWDCWPRKEAQIAALKLWKRLWFAGELPSLPAMLDKIDKFKQHDRSWQRGFVPYLVNWLRAERWKDDQQAGSQSTSINPVDTTEVQSPLDDCAREKSLDDFLRLSREHTKRLMLESEDPRIVSLATSKFGGSNAEERQEEFTPS